LAGEQKEPGKERKEGAVQFTFCWAHVRRKFFEFHHATGSPSAAKTLRRIAELYQIEARIPGRPFSAPGPAKPRAGRWSRL
jgi:Transposase IS66 family